MNRRQNQHEFLQERDNFQFPVTSCFSTHSVEIGKVIHISCFSTDLLPSFRCIVRLSKLSFIGWIYSTPSPSKVLVNLSWQDVGGKRQNFAFFIMDNPRLLEIIYMG